MLGGCGYRFKIKSALFKSCKKSIFLSDNSNLNLYKAFSNFYKFEQYPDLKIPSFPCDLTFLNYRDDGINEQGLEFTLNDYGGNPYSFTNSVGDKTSTECLLGTTILISTRVEIYFKLLFFYPKISQVIECIGPKGNIYYDYDFDFVPYDFDNVFKMQLDKVEIVGYAYMDKGRGIIRIGYRWLNAGNALEWGRENLINLIRPNLFNCFIDCEESPKLVYELSEDGYTNYLYCDLGYKDYRTDYYTISYLANFYERRYEDVETSKQVKFYIL